MRRATDVPPVTSGSLMVLSPSVTTHTVTKGGVKATILTVGVPVGATVLTSMRVVPADVLIKAERAPVAAQSCGGWG
jgi:hypothetical protein